MAFIAIPAQKPKHSSQMSSLVSESELKLKKIGDLANLYIEMQTQLSSNGLNKDDLENIRIKINEFIAKLQNVDKEIFNAVFKGISPIKRPLKSFILKKFLAQKLKEFFDEIFQRIYRKSELSNETKTEINKSIERQVKLGPSEFKEDSIKCIEGFYSTMVVSETQKITFQNVKIDTEKQETLIEDLKIMLNKFLLSKEVDKEDIVNFTNLIFLLFSQVADIQFLTAPIKQELDGDIDKGEAEFLITSFPRKDICENFDETIEILNPKTIRIQIKAKDPKHIFNIRKFDMFMEDFQEKGNGVKIRDVQTSFTFQLDTENNWHVIDKETFFIISEIF